MVCPLLFACCSLRVGRLHVLAHGVGGAGHVETLAGVGISRTADLDRGLAAAVGVGRLEIAAAIILIVQENRGQTTV